MSIVIHPDFAQAIAEQWLTERDEVAITRERLAELEQQRTELHAMRKIVMDKDEELDTERDRVAALDQPFTIDPEYAGACFHMIAEPAHQHADTHPDQPVITFSEYVDILAAIVGHQRAAEVLLGDLDNWKPTGILAALKANDPAQLSPESQAAIHRTVNRNDAAGEPYGVWPCQPEGS